MKKTLTATIQATALVNAAAKRGELPAIQTEQGWVNRRVVTVCRHGLNIEKDWKYGRDCRMNRVTITPCKSWKAEDDYTKTQRRSIAVAICKALRAQGFAVRVETVKVDRWANRQTGARVVGEWRRGR